MIRQAFLAAATLLAVSPALAQGFPDKPTRLIIPYGTGGITDITARVVAPRLGTELGQQIVV